MQAPSGRYLAPKFPSKAPALKLAYLVNTYPCASHSFIRREIAALERAGVAVNRVRHAVGPGGIEGCG
jgi:hypothetical protein